MVVTRARGEQSQLELIRLDYVSRGYDVLLEQPFEIAGRRFVPDAIAIRRASPDAVSGENDEETIIIELVNAQGNSQERDARTDFLTQLFAREPSWKLDVRYIDNPTIVEERAVRGVDLSWRSADEATQAPPRRSLKTLRTRKRVVKNSMSMAPEYLRVWSYLAQTLRVWERWYVPQAFSESPLNAVWASFVEGPGRRLRERGQNPGFVQFEDYAQIALQGGIVDKTVVSQLWTFYLAVHRAVSSVRENS